MTRLARDRQRKPRRAGHDDLLPAGTRHYLSLESAATHIRSYSAQAIPDLLQTHAYGTAAARATRPDLTLPQAIRLATLHARRQELLNAGTCQLHLILHNAALRQPIAPAPVITAQLRRLITATTTSPALTIQVTTPAAPAVLSPSFTLLSFPAPARPAASYPGPAGQTTTTRNPADLHAATATWNALTRIALTPQASLTFLTEFTTQLTRLTSR